MMRRITCAGAVALALVACTDREPTTAPAVFGSTSPSSNGDSRSDGNLRGGAVYVMTNQLTGNAVTAFSRAPDGTLTLVGTFPTGGLGTGGPPDPLRSQGSLILSGQEPGAHVGLRSNQLLFAVNAGSNEISVLAVERDRLTLVCKTASGGVRPTSLTLHKDLLYVLNAGSGTITGFRVGHDGGLTPLAGSTRPITGGATADPAQVEFTPDGKVLVVTGKMTNVIDTYRVDREGLPNGPTPNASNGLTPFGFAFDNRGNLIVSEAFGGAPNQAAMSSYTVSRDGVLKVVSGSVRDFQTAACWVVVTDNGRYAYTSNTGSSTISSYRVHPDGTLELLASIAAMTDPGSSPVDMALSTGSRYLYVLNDVTGTIDVFRVESDGGLAPVAGAAGLPPNAQGIAAR
jgi:6-phosphogluconolactonase